jgi:predicted RNA-binding Zn-ribbon protein involved in translation (DUF1610 family)
MKITIGKKLEEKLSHFVCGSCRKWWTIGDAAIRKTKWFCPWCGKVQTFSKAKKSRG